MSTVGYLRDLDRAIPGRGRAKRDLMREITGGLEDARDALVDEGYELAEAERAAVDEFGPVDEIARHCSTELLALSTRRLAIVFAIMLPVVMSVWQLIWATLPPSSSAALTARAPVWFATVSRIEDWFQLAMAGGAIIAVFLLSRASIRSRRPTRLVVAVCVWILVSVAITTVLGQILSAAMYDPGSSSATITLTGILTNLLAMSVSIMAVRTLYRVRRLRS